MRFLVTLFFLWASVCFADADYDRGDDLFYGRGVRQNYAEALNSYIKSAENKNPDAMNNAGYMLRMGLGTEKNDAEAFKWYTMSADSGNILGMYNLGLMYKNGIGTEKSFPDAVTWLTRAAETGMSEAMNALGNMYEQSEEPDYTAAISWFSAGADKGYAYAQYNLGMMIKNGLGTVKDMETANTWIGMAAAQGLKEAADELGKKPEEIKPVPIVQAPKLITVDPATGLVWQDNEDAARKEMFWKDAVTYCDTLTLNGVIGWRMPTAKELLSITDPKKTPAVRVKFRNQSNDTYWSSKEDRKNARVVYMFNGSDYWMDKEYLNRVRCVRKK
ncbi:MAG: DUF1566 domain-containing protein [Deferribacterales bacterium]